MIPPSTFNRLLRPTPVARAIPAVAASRAVAAAMAEGAATEAEAAISRWRLRRRDRGAGDGAERDARVDALIVGLGNPGREYSGTRHNLGFEIAAELSRRWELPNARKRYGGLITDGRTGPGGPRVAILLPQTFMNESGSAAGPARGELGVPLDHVIALHDEIDLPFGEVRSKLGGGVAGHNGLKSLSQGLGGKDFWRVRGGVGRPDSTDPEIVSNYVLSRFREPDDEVRGLIQSSADEAERLLERLAGAGAEPAGEEA
jgi:peptidyl-tRNA hydrolase, PTH1 family